MAILLELFLTFFKIGLFTFGGGYAMLSIIENNCVDKKKWITHEEMMNITVIAESTPGPIAINCATYVGLKQKGVLGSIIATVGVILPSFIIIFLVSAFLDKFLEIKWVASAFRGIKLAVGIIIVGASVKMLIKSDKKPLSIIVFGASFIVMTLINIFALKISTIVLLLVSAIVGFSVYTVKNCADKGAGK